MSSRLADQDIETEWEDVMLLIRDGQYWLHDPEDGRMQFHGNTKPTEEEFKHFQDDQPKGEVCQ